ncbi:MAG: tetratricopeptide repeat protein, partial [Gammaproteobacteria bacterium]|nr:tetratricopeptide repeat protein [Gammaproteobacteria bacterium]
SSGKAQSDEKKAVADNNEATVAKEVAEAAEASEVKEVTEITAVSEASDVEKVAGATEVKDAVEAMEITAVAVALDVEKVAGATEVKDAADATEITAVAEVSDVEEVAGATEVKEAADVTEMTEPTETGPVDYKALGLRSVELNPNDYPDEVITLLEPHKYNKSNNSVLFYSSLGLAYKSKGRLNDAIAAYRRALGLASNVPAPSIQYNLGIAYYYNSELHKSFNCFLNSSAQRSNHPGTEKWIKHIANELDIYKVPDISKLKLVVNQKISVNRIKDDRESRVRVYLTQNGGRIQELSVKDKIYAYGIDSDTVRPVDYVIIDNDGDGSFDNVINTKGKFGVPTWAYNPD